MKSDQWKTAKLNGVDHLPSRSNATFLCKQVALTGTQIYWTVEVTAAFARLEEGYENALRDYYRKQVRIGDILYMLCVKIEKSRIVHSVVIIDRQLSNTIHFVLLTCRYNS